MDFSSLPREDAERALETVRREFSAFSEWDSVNEDDGEHCGFAVWGVRELDPDSYPSRAFYVTLVTYQAEWRGHLTIGQHAHMFSSADFGDAYLCTVEGCGSLDEAIVALKREIAGLFDTLLPGR